MFADDSNMLFSCKTTNNVENIINIKLNQIHKWLYTNKLYNNLSKTNLWFLSSGNVALSFIFDDMSKRLNDRLSLFTYCERTGKELRGSVMLITRFTRITP